MSIFYDFVTAPYAVPEISPVKLFFDNGLAPVGPFADGGMRSSQAAGTTGWERRPRGAVAGGGRRMPQVRSSVKPKAGNAPASGSPPGDITSGGQGRGPRLRGVETWLQGSRTTRTRPSETDPPRTDERGGDTGKSGVGARMRRTPRGFGEDPGERDRIGPERERNVDRTEARRLTLLLGSPGGGVQAGPMPCTEPAARAVTIEPVAPCCLYARASVPPRPAPPRSLLAFCASARWCPGSSRPGRA